MFTQHQFVSRASRFIPLILASLSAPLFAAGLNDTGISRFGDASSNSLTTEPANFPGQDASRGRDAAAQTGTLSKIGAGAAGFDYTKIANDGSELPKTAQLGTSPKDWACTRDNVTGLLWEMKTTDGGLHDASFTYTWYNTNSSTNGGYSGTQNGGNCYISGRCDTQSYVVDVNSAGLCGYTDWRLPTRRELLSIVNYAKYEPAIDEDYFPNMIMDSGWELASFWSSSPDTNDSSNAWDIYFFYGYTDGGYKSSALGVRLARARQ